jgi:hypothetical protein
MLSPDSGAQRDPQLYQAELGGTLGGAIIKDKPLGFISYQHIHSSVCVTA